MDRSLESSSAGSPPRYSSIATEIIGFLFLVLLIAVVVRVLQRVYNSRSQMLRGIPGPKGWPVVGNLLQLGHSPHLQLTDWWGQYGDIYSLQLGNWPTVVLNGFDTVREALVRNADAFSSRPDFHTFKNYGGGKSISFSPYQPSLKTHRRITSQALKKLMADPAVVEETILREAGLLVENLTRPIGLTNPAPAVTLAVAAIMYSVAFGQDADIRKDRRLCELLTGQNPATELFAVGNQIDFMPWIRHFTRSALHRDNIQHMSDLFQISKDKVNQCLNTSSGIQCIVSLMNSKIKSLLQSNVDLTDPRTLPNKEHLVGTAVEFLSAGSDTSSTELLWLIVYMAAYPQTQDKVFEELNNIVKRGHSLTSYVLQELPFTEACILEVMRLTSIVPFGLPHCTSKPAELGPYYIPRNTLVLVNLWSVSRDNTVWDEPDTFRPERFLKLDERSGDIVLNRQVASQFLPFSTGRRRCVGEALGRRQVYLIFINIMHRCRFCLPAGEHPDLEPVFGDILKPRPFRVEISRRHPDM